MRLQNSAPRNHLLSTTKHWQEHVRIKLQWPTRSIHLASSRIAIKMIRPLCCRGSQLQTPWTTTIPSSHHRYTRKWLTVVILRSRQTGAGREARSRLQVVGATQDKRMLQIQVRRDWRRSANTHSTTLRVFHQTWLHCQRQRRRINNPCWPKQQASVNYQTTWTQPWISNRLEQISNSRQLWSVCHKCVHKSRRVGNILNSCLSTLSWPSAICNSATYLV